MGAAVTAAGPGDRYHGRAVPGGPASGTLAIVVDRNGGIVGPRPPGVASLPVAEGVDGALEDGRNVRDASLGDTPVRVLIGLLEI